MDQYKLITIIKQHPQVWDRTNELFNKKEFKEKAWTNIGSQMGMTGAACKDAFKSLREKYIREREKASQMNPNQRVWELLHHLKFLDPHIIFRQRYSTFNNESLSDEQRNSNQMSEIQNIFDKKLITFVRDTEELWNRSCSMYTMNKPLKNQLWHNIAQKLNKDDNFCILRWKALREKYIRQKNKPQVGEQKWELLDDMKFLDKVILYRRKVGDNSTTNLYSSQGESINQNECHFYSGSEDNSINSNDFLMAIKEEFETEIPDSSVSADKSRNVSDVSNGDSMSSSSMRNPDSSSHINAEISISNSKRKSDDNDGNNAKRSKTVSSDEKSPEDLFGDLVAVMLKKLPVNDRNVAMVEIMRVLTK